MSISHKREVNLGSTLPGPEPEWPATLDVHALLADGWEPTPFREFVLKIHSRCTLACDYCYMYELADKTWRLRPRRMPRLSRWTRRLDPLSLGGTARPSEKLPF